MFSLVFQYLTGIAVFSLTSTYSAHEEFLNNVSGGDDAHITQSDSSLNCSRLSKRSTSSPCYLPPFVPSSILWPTQRQRRAEGAVGPGFLWLYIALNRCSALEQNIPPLLA